MMLHECPRYRRLAGLVLTLAAVLAAGAASAAPWSGWTWLGPEGGSFVGVVRVPEADNSYYAWSYRGGVFRSTDGGRSWQAVNRGLRLSEGIQDRVTEVVTSPAGDSLYMADYELWHRGSGPWRQVAVPDAAWTIRFDPRDPLTRWLGTYQGVFRSTNGGQTWQRRSDGLGADRDAETRHLALSADGAVLYAVTQRFRSSVYRSTDDGASWVRTSLPLSGNGSITCLVSDPTRPDSVYACVDRFGLFRSRDGGRSWQLALQDASRGGRPGYAVAFATAAPQIVWFAGESGLFRSTDGGNEWSQVLLEAPLQQARGVAVSADGKTVVVATLLDLWRSGDGGDTWEVVQRGLRAADFQSISGTPSRPQDLFGVDGLLERSRDGGATWERSPPPGDFFTQPLLYRQGPVSSPADPQRLYLALGTTLYRSDDAGDTWTVLPAKTMGTVDLLLPHPTAVDTLVASDRLRGLLYSEDGGASWQPAFELDPEYRSFHADEGMTDPTDADRLYVLGDRVDANHFVHEVLLRSSDGGAGFDAVYEVGGFGAAAVDAAGTVYVAERGPDDVHRLVYSRNGGLTWHTAGHLGADQWPTKLEAHPTEAGTLVVIHAFDAAPRITTDGGYSWRPLDLTGLPDPWPFLYDVYWRGGDQPRLYLATAGGLYARGADDCPADSPGALCLGNGRYEVRARWRTADGKSGTGKGVPLTADTGYFWFFRQANVELLVKVLDACGAAGRIWAFAGGLTNVEVELEVLDRRTGARRLYVNPQQTPFAPVQDTGAFASCPPEHAFAMAAAAARPSASPRAAAAAEAGSVLSLAGGRYQVRVDWSTADAESGPATAVPLSDDTGYFWFFRDSNVELVVKVLDGCAVNQRYWIFAGGLTNVGTEITVTDTLSGFEHTYATTAGPAFAPLQDTTTFATCP